MFGILWPDSRGSDTATANDKFTSINQASGQMKLSDSPSHNGGFDIVIGNPPYVRQEQLKDQKSALQASCPDTYTSTADLYVYFYDRGLQFLHDGGVLSYISSNKYFRASYGKNLRQHLATNTAIQQIIDFGDTPVFTAIAYPTIVITKKGKGRTGIPACGSAECSTGFQPVNFQIDQSQQNTRSQAGTPVHPSENTFRALNWAPDTPITGFARTFHENAFKMRQDELSEDGWHFDHPDVLHLLDKLRKTGTPLGEYVNGRFYRGILTGYNKAFVIDRVTRDRLIAEEPNSSDIIKPFLRGRDVKRWRVNFAEQYLIKLESSENNKHPWSGKPEKEAEKIFKQTYPAIHKWFQQYRENLINRYDQGHYWWELRACKYWKEFENVKITYPDIAQSPEFAFDDSGYYLANTMYLMPTQEKWLIGLLNSSPVWWFYNQISNKIRGGFVRFIAQYVEQIPIPAATEEQQSEIESLVDQILDAKRANPEADISDLETKVDEMVTELYGVSQTKEDK